MIDFNIKKLDIGDTIVTDLNEYCLVTRIDKECFFTQNKLGTPTLGNARYIIKKL